MEPPCALSLSLPKLDSGLRSRKVRDLYTCLTQPEKYASVSFLGDASWYRILTASLI
jgi:hypothetical protein